MGLRDALKRNDAEVSLEVDPPDVRPGEDVRLRITIAGELDDKVQGARAGLRGVHEYLVRERDRNSSRDDDWDEVWRSVTLHEEVADVAPQLGVFEVTCQVPHGSAPSSPQVVRWEAFAIVDRRRGLDATATAPVVVRSSADALPAQQPEPPMGEGGVRITGVPARVRTGEPFEGVIEVTPDDDVKATGVVVELTRVRTYTEGNALDVGVGGLALDLGGLGLRLGSSTIVKKDDLLTVEVAGGQELPAGRTTRIPFEVVVPDDAGASLVAPHGVVEFRLQATVQRRMRRDLDAVATVGVFTG